MQVFSDATITVPLVVQALRASGKSRKSVPVFDWSGEELGLRYEKDLTKCPPGELQEAEGEAT